ncbi:MAG: DUF3187 family protein [Gammaproteobacteria bacterium]|nr:DUF3187 family protein [Gammaproteobacteria bacterium]
MQSAKSPVWPVASRAFLGLCILLSSSHLAHSASPLQTHDLNPLTLIYGLPLASPARLPATDSSVFSVSLNASNTINIEDVGTESLYIDGETKELNLIYLFALSQRSSLRLRLPLISHEAGSLDNFIDDFHHAFGFPEGLRPLYQQDQLLFLYQQNNTELLRLDSANNHIGDITVDLAYQLYADNTQSASIWSSLKLPTGQAADLSGSGQADIAVWFAQEYRFRNNWWRYYNIGLLLSGKSEVLTEQQKSDVLFATAGIEWQPLQRLVLNIQLDFHSAFYQSQTEFLGDSIQLSSGGHIKFGNNKRLEIVVVEDIQVGASPDVTFQLGFSQSFN